MQFLGLFGNVGAGISRNSVGVQYSCSVINLDLHAYTLLLLHSSY